jgi:hypothetical protein
MPSAQYVRGTLNIAKNAGMSDLDVAVTGMSHLDLAR